MRPILETQEHIRAMTRPLERMSAINSQILNCQIPSHSVRNAAIEVAQNPAVIAATEMARQVSPDQGVLNAAIEAAQSPAIMAASEAASKMVEPMGLAALQMTNLQLDTAALQFANSIERVLPPDYMTNIQGALNAYS